MRHPDWARSIVVVLAASSACGPMADDGGDAGGTAEASSGSPGTTAMTASESTATAPPVTVSTADGASDTNDPVDCDSLPLEECDFSGGCQTANGPEATPEGGPGEYYCSDLIMPFACVSPDCEPVPGIFILCKIDEPGVAVWVLDECLPAGWEPCPDAVCA